MGVNAVGVSGWGRSVIELRDSDKPEVDALDVVEAAVPLLDGPD